MVIGILSSKLSFGGSESSFFYSLIKTTISSVGILYFVLGKGIIITGFEDKSIASGGDLSRPQSWIALLGKPWFEETNQLVLGPERRRSMAKIEG